MYRLLKVEEPKIMRNLEKSKKDLFGHKPSTEKRSRGVFSREIETGEVLAFQCLEDEKQVGGMLLGSKNGNIMIHRVYVEENEMDKGAGSFMVKYVKDHKEFFDAYFGQNSEGIIVEPIYGEVQPRRAEHIATGRRTYR